MSNTRSACVHYPEHRGGQTGSPSNSPHDYADEGIVPMLDRARHGEDIGPAAEALQHVQLR